MARELLAQLKKNHLSRMVSGKCSAFADASFMNLLTDLRRIADGCTNVGEATLIRAFPNIAEQEHTYFAELRSGNNEQFNREFSQAQERYALLMDAVKTKTEDHEKVSGEPMKD